MNELSKAVLDSILMTDLDVSVRTLTICRKLEIKTLCEFNMFPWYSIVSVSTDLRTSRPLIRLSLKALNKLLQETYEATHKQYFLDKLSKEYDSYYD